MKRGGYTATLDGFHDAGLETTVPLALDDLADKLTGWIEALDEVADSMPHREPNERGESALSDAVRQLLREGSCAPTRSGGRRGHARSRRRSQTVRLVS